MENEYKFRQCPGDENVQCNMSEDRCAECPIAGSAPHPMRMTNAEYIKSLDETGILALLNVTGGGDMDVLGERCSLCRFGNADKCIAACKAGAGGEIQKECDKAERRWLFDEARALVDAVEKERMRILK